MGLPAEALCAKDVADGAPAALVAELPLAELTNEAPAPVDVPVETGAPKLAAPDAGVEAFAGVADGLDSST